VHLTEVPATDFDLAITLDSGQVFHWQRFGRGFVGMIADLPIYVEQRGDVLRASQVGCKLDRLNRSSFARTVRHYFALDHPLAEICRSLPCDPIMDAAREFCWGLRIIRQPKWECLATFICSSMKQVVHIRQISLALRKRFGHTRAVNPAKERFAAAETRVLHEFPSAERLAEASESELRGCALGYRAKNLLGTARLVAGGRVDLEKLSNLSDAELGKVLCTLPGVGAKVANCVMLFAYERLRAFPIDVWIERVLRQTYLPKTRKLNAARLRMFTEKYFGEHGGYAQQYLFHFARINRRTGKI
jgi:N-glycosylase/DNA lyase